MGVLFFFMGVLFFLLLFPHLFFLLIFPRTDNRTEVSKTLVLYMVIVLRQEGLFKKRAS